MKGQGGNLLFILIFQLLVWGGCAQQDSRAITAGPGTAGPGITTFYPFLLLEGLDPAQRFQKINDHFAYGCEENLKLIQYVQKRHVKGDQIDVVSLLQTAIQNILKEGRLSTPYFTENTKGKVLKTIEIEKEGKKEKVEIKPPVLVHYISFMLEQKSFMAAKKAMSDFRDMNNFCSTVESLSDVIKDRSDIDFEKSESPPRLLTLFHKSIFRYFVASLDPHSLILESPERWYVDNGLSDQLRRGSHENISDVSPSQDNPYYPRDEEATPPWKAEWIGESSVLRVEFRTFDEFTADKFQATYQQYLREKNISALVIDLRRNRGGSAVVVAKLADLFLKEGEVLLMREKMGEGWQMIRDQNGEAFRAKAGNELPGIENIPVVILVSRYSCSSSETFAAAMQDYEGAMIIGEKTFGKGTGQRSPMIHQLSLGIDSSARLDLTTLYTYSPKGAPLQLQGITPDIEVEDRDYDVNRLTSLDQLYYTMHREVLQPHALPMPEPLQTEFQDHSHERMSQWKEKLRAYFESHNHLFSLDSLGTSLAAAF